MVFSMDFVPCTIAPRNLFHLVFIYQMMAILRIETHYEYFGIALRIGSNVVFFSRFRLKRKKKQKWKTLILWLDINTREMKYFLLASACSWVEYINIIGNLTNDDKCCQHFHLKKIRAFFVCYGCLSLSLSIYFIYINNTIAKRLCCVWQLLFIMIIIIQHSTFFSKWMERKTKKRRINGKLWRIFVCFV